MRENSSKKSAMVS